MHGEQQRIMMQDVDEDEREVDVIMAEQARRERGGSCSSGHQVVSSLTTSDNDNNED